MGGQADPPDPRPFIAGNADREEHKICDDPKVLGLKQGLHQLTAAYSEGITQNAQVTTTKASAYEQNYKTNPEKTEKKCMKIKNNTNTTSEPEEELKHPNQEKEKNEKDRIAEEMPFPALFDLFLSNVKATLSQAGNITMELISIEDGMLLQQMFTTIFLQHRSGELPNEKEHLPTLQPEEHEGLLRLYWAEVVHGGVTCQQWRNRLRDLTKTLFRSRRSLLESIELRENELKIRASNVVNPWASNPLLGKIGEEEDEPMEEENNVVRFRQDVYSANEILEMRSIYTEYHDFPSELRSPTELEKKVTQGLLEGSILAQGLPQFLKRTCDNDMLRAIQNTIYAQVEGELFLQLPAEFPVYPDFQTRERLVGAILQGARKGEFDLSKLTQMLGETKQVCYNSQQHSVHLFFWTRESATGWSNIFQFVPFRNRRFKLTNARPEEDHYGDTPSVRSARVWKRQIGSDGVRNEQRHGRYKIKLLNVSRFMDEAALDAFIRAKFNGSYVTFQEPKYGRQMFQTGAWEIYFRSPGCPSFLEKVRFINWMGKKILVHHVGMNPAPPCYNCGASGHTVVQCKYQSDGWKKGNGCLQVTSSDIEKLERRQSTVTSVKELESMWKKVSENSKNASKVSNDKKQGNTTTKEEAGTIGGKDQMELASTGIDEKESSTMMKDPDKAVMQKLEWKTPKKSKTFRPGKSIRVEVMDTSNIASDEMEHEAINLVESAESQCEPSEQAINADAPATRKFIMRPDELSKQKRLIFEAITRKQTKVSQEQTKRCEEIEIATVGQLEDTEVLKLCGLNPVETPATGNCQFYAIAMALLNCGFDDLTCTSAIENVTDKLKKGARLAAQHGFEVEFPHEIRKAYLSSQLKGAGELTIRESEEKMKVYLTDLLTTSSSRTAFVAQSYWGSELTLLMMAKLLERPIFLAVASNSLNTASYQIFKPIRKVTTAYELQSAGEFHFRAKSASKWIEALQNECKKCDEIAPLPIVLHFKQQHYTWLRLGDAPSDILLHEFLSKEDLDTETDEGTNPNEEDDFIMEEKIMKEDGKKSATSLKTGLTTKPQEAVARAFSAQGPQGLAPELQNLLHNLDWKNESQVQLMIQTSGTDFATLQQWQQMLIQEEVASTTTPEEDDENMSSSDTSEWAPDSEHGAPDKSRVNQRPTPDPDEPSKSRQSRFSEGGRSVEKVKLEEWNALEERWRKFSEIPFPKLPVDSVVWERAVQKHPNVLMEWLQQVDSPEYVVRTVKLSTIRDWTRQFRIDCLLMGMTELQKIHERREVAGTAIDQPSLTTMKTWITHFKEQRNTMMDDSYLHSKDLWGVLNKLKPDKVQLLQLCRSSKTDRLAKQIVAAFAYAPELGRMLGQPEVTSFLTGDVLNRFVQALQSFPKVHRAFYGSGADGDWAALETILALQLEATMDTKRENEITE